LQYLHSDLAASVRRRHPSNKVRKGHVMAFKPNAVTFKQGIERIQNAVKSSGLQLSGNIVTSRDPAVRKAADALKVTNVPEGFKKWQLPVYMDGPSQFFISIGAPDLRVPAHSHDEGDGIRFIIGGSILYEGKELTEGDWMFIPKGKPYQFQVGPGGVSMCYCYQCCCA
jgi:hypothetical protein